jgi:hypothetical protein
MGKMPRLLFADIGCHGQKRSGYTRGVIQGVLLQSDTVGIMLAAAAFHFKRSLTVILWLITKLIFMPANKQQIRFGYNFNRICWAIGACQGMSM